LAANAIAYGVAPAASAATRPTRSQTAGLDSHPTLSNSAQALGTGSYPSLSTGSSASLFSQALLFVGENLLTGATRQAGSQLYDWGLAALGLANGAANSATQLADIRSELEAIQSQLADIDNALSLVSDEIQQLNCDQYGVGLENAVSTIQADYQIYETDYGQQGSTWSTTPATNVAVLDQFIAQVTQETYEGGPPELATPYSLVSALDTITGELVPTGGTQGALAACISAAGGAPKPGTFGTLSYYDNEVLPIEEYWYAYQLDALGSSTATFTLGDTLDGDAPTIEVTSFALSGASQTEYFADSAAGLEFTSGALTASTTSDRALGPVDVEFIDENGVETVPPPSQSVLAVEYRCTDSCDFASSSDGENQGAAILVSPSRTTSTSAYQVPTYHVYFSAPTAGTMTITAEAVNSDLSPFPTSAAWETHQDEAIASSPASLVLPDKTTRGR
jgi:hypothetical protein